jgi:EAL and modified HD-GYP domain-containing signal transduction protein
VVIVGLAQLRGWVALLTLTDDGPARVTLTATLVRARACELLVEQRSTGAPDAAFTVGLLDGLAEAFGLSAAEFIALLPPLAPAVAGALHGRGPLAAALTAVRGHEEGGSADGRPDVAEAYLAALAWAGQMSLLVDESTHPRPKAPC